MSETEWLVSEEPYDLLRHLHQKANGPIGRWLSLARLSVDHLDHAKLLTLQQAVADLLPPSLSERWARLLCGRGTFYIPNLGLHEVLQALMSEDNGADERLAAFNRVAGFMPTLVRDIFGNPFKPSKLNPSWLAWNDGSISKAAAAAYSEREMPSGHLDNARLAVLADMLEEAGCRDEEVLGHLREPGAVHVRGCWCVDLLTGKE